MDNLDELKTIWRTADTNSLPSSKEMLQLVRKFRNQKIRNKWFIIISSCLLCGIIITVLCIVHFKMLSTYLGGALMASSGLLLAVTNIRSLKRFYRLGDYSNVDFLAFIEQTRQNQIYYYKKTMVYILLLCSVGWLLYMYEALHVHPKSLISIYALFLTYLAIMWFVVRPRAFKKGTKKLDATRQRLETILKQLQ